MVHGFFALAVAATFINRFFALPEKLQGLGYIQISKSAGAMLSTVGNILFFLAIGSFAVWVFYVFFSNLKELRSEHSSPSHDESNFNSSNLKELTSEGN